MSELSDKQIRKRIWYGSVPIMFTLEPSDLSVAQDPGPYFTLVPRGGYITLLSSKLRAYFGPSANALGEELWFEHDRTALRWHYPAGVLFDMLADTSKLPWSVVVHFSHFPITELLRCPSDDTVKQHFENVLKESQYLKHGDGGRVNSLSLEDSTNLWEGLLSGDYDTFWRANEKLACATNEMTSVPMRLCRRGEPAMQDRIAPLRDDGTERTLEDVLIALLPAPLLSKVCNKTRPDAPDVRVAPTTRASVDVVANKTLPLAVESAAASSSSSASTSTALTVRSAAATTGTTSSTTQSALTESQTAITPPSTPARALSAQPSSDDVTRAVSATTSPATAAAGATSDGDDASLSRSRAIEHNARTPVAVEIVVQGIAPPLCTSVAWLAHHLAAPDGFVYLVVRDTY